MKEIDKQRHIPRRKKLLVRVLYFLVRSLCATVRLRVDREKETNDRVAREGGIMVTWHGRSLLAINRFRGRRNVYGLISMSKDGDLQAEIFRCYGMKVIRGSTGRRGVLATREVLNVLERGEIVVCTPDGPRGPIEKAQAGALYFAQRTGLSISPAGVAAYPCWKMNSWDNYMIPKPFSRARWIYGDPFYVAPDEPIEAAQQRLTDELNRLQSEAERIVQGK